jgi:hypothetical protein
LETRLNANPNQNELKTALKAETRMRLSKALTAKALFLLFVEV